MNTESNSGITWPLIFSTLGRSGATAGSQALGLNAFNGSGESQFQQMITQFMAEQSLQAAAAEASAAGSSDAAGENGEPDVSSDYLSKLLCAECSSIYNFQSIDHRPEVVAETDGKLESTPETYASSEAEAERSRMKTDSLKETISLLKNEKTSSQISEARSSDGIQSLMSSTKDLNHKLSSPETAADHLKKGDLAQVKNKQESTPKPSAEFFKGIAEQERTFQDGQKTASPADTGIAEKVINGQPIEARTKIEAAVLNKSDAEHLNPLQSAGLSSGTAEWSPVTQAVEKAEPYSQIGEEILAKLGKKESAEFKMLLNPGELGEIDINLKVKEGKLIIDILAANAKTQALLTGQADKLIASMGLRNVQVESIQVSQQMLQNQDGQSQNNEMNSAMDFSQRKHQEQQLQRKFFNEGRLDGPFGKLQAETPDNSPVNRIGAYRYDSHRINYAV